jgi:hypothetical protein
MPTVTALRPHTAVAPKAASKAMWRIVRVVRVVAIFGGAGFGTG